MDEIKDVKEVNEAAESKGSKKARRKKTVKRIVGIVILAVCVLCLTSFIKRVSRTMGSMKSFDVTDEKFEEICPENKELSSRIAKVPLYSADDTWAFYVYIVGSDLESSSKNAISDTVTLMIKDEVDRIAEESARKTRDNLSSFVNELEAQDIDMPSVLYEPNLTEKTMAAASDTIISALGSTVLSNTESQGFATTNILQMTDSETPENLKIVFQTGGAAKWSEGSFNPNRSQRFLIENSTTYKIYDEKPVDMGAPESLTDFLKFCRREYPADHQVVLLWNHGAGAFGYGLDEIYGDLLTLEQIQKAFRDAVGSPNENNPAFEAIGFDACLMASTEAAYRLNGFAKYLYASEETEPGDGWNYKAILDEFKKHPAMNGALLGKIISDTYMRLCVETGAEAGNIANATFSVIDLSKTDELYDAYSAFAKKAVAEVAKSPAALGDISRAAESSMHFAGSASDSYNTIDLGLFMDALPAYLSPEADSVKAAINSSVLYLRNTTYTAEAQGITVYYPLKIQSLYSLENFLSYINEVSDDPYINALYYYKSAGCINDEQRQALLDQGIQPPANIDYSVMESVAYWSDLEIDGNGGMKIQISDDYMPLVQNVRLFVAAANEEVSLLGDDMEMYVSHGESADVSLSEDGHISSAFDGKWLSYGDVPLETTVISENGDNVRYKAKVIYNDMLGYMIINYNKAEDSASLLGISRSSDQTDNVLDKNMYMPKKGDTVQVIKTKYNGTIGSEEISEKVNVSNSTRVEVKALPDGDYIECFMVVDLRSDEYGSNIAEFTMKGGKLTDHKIYEYSSEKQ